MKDFQVFCTQPGAYVEGKKLTFWDGFYMSEYEFDSEVALKATLEKFRRMAAYPPAGSPQEVVCSNRIDTTDGKWHLWFSKDGQMAWEECKSLHAAEEIRGQLYIQGYECTSCCGWGCCDCGHNGYV